MSGRLKERIAIVTGAGQGIGAAIARRFVEEGARVMIAELNAETAVATARALRDDGYTALAVETDVASWPSVQHMVEETVKELGYPDVLVGLRAPLGREDSGQPIGEVVCRSRLGGLLHEYTRQAA